MSLIHDFIDLFFPRVCEGCGNLLFRNEETICTRCLVALPKTNFHKYPDNPVMETFWGRIKLESASSFLYYSKAGKVQRMIHNFKYHKKTDVGRVLGKMFASDLITSPYFQNIPLLVPVPLHWTKLKTRGFNQSEVIAKAMSEIMHGKVETEVLIRKFATDTQTKKSRMKRLENVSGKFDMQFPERIAGKHILLVDDVITTGSTIEECASLLLSVDGVKISLASIGFAGK
ncbi:MAG: ComF family protein [Bacteroidales bacterium]|nr:ComF family protein [Bacteroidales bacterium]